MATGTEARFDMSDLMAEVRRYLVAVEGFRAEGREPVWLREARTHDLLPSETTAIALPTKINR